MTEYTYGTDEKCIKNLVARPERRDHLGRPRHRWKGNKYNGSKINLILICRLVSSSLVEDPVA
jgi:hypothetical protein